MRPNQYKTKITNLWLWLEAWNILIRGMTHFYPSLAPHMLVYQELMCTFMRAYPFPACYRYDVATLLNIASNVYSRSDVLFDYAFNRFIRCAEPAASVSPQLVTSVQKRVTMHPTARRSLFVPQQLILNRAGSSPAGDITAEPSVNTLANTCISATNAAETTHATRAEALMKNLKPLPGSITTPVNVTSLELELSNHLDNTFVSDLIFRFRAGFRIGYGGPQSYSISSNLKPAITNPAR